MSNLAKVCSQFIRAESVWYIPIPPSALQQDVSVYIQILILLPFMGVLLPEAILRL
jgi:hypothetical protein